MSEAFAGIQQGLLEAIDFAQGNTENTTVHKVDVKTINANVDVTPDPLCGDLDDGERFLQRTKRVS